MNNVSGNSCSPNSAVFALEPGAHHTWYTFGCLFACVSLLKCKCCETWAFVLLTTELLVAVAVLGHGGPIVG